MSVSGEIPEQVSLLDVNGTRIDDDRYGQWIDGLGSEQLLGMYRDMVLARRFDAEATALQRQGELGLWPPMLGQEAAQIGSGWATNPTDFVVPSYREHGVALTRGMDPALLLPLFRGQRHGGWDPARYNFHLYTMVIGAQPLHAVGYAQGLQRDGVVGTGDPSRDQAVIVYFGDGATSEGDCNEAMVFAGAAQAPVVFFCQNNQWAISAPVSVQTRVPLSARGTGYGIPSVQVDGNDVLACYAVTHDALARARSGGGPTFIEAFTYRMGAHTTADDPTRYRTRDEERIWRERDPIERMRRFLTEQGVADASYFENLDSEADALAQHVRDYCHALTPPPPESMFEHIYAHPHPLVDEEREWFARYTDDGREVNA